MIGKWMLIEREGSSAGSFLFFFSFSPKLFLDRVNSGDKSLRSFLLFLRLLVKKFSFPSWAVLDSEERRNCCHKRSREGGEEDVFCCTHCALTLCTYCTPVRICAINLPLSSSSSFSHVHCSTHLCLRKASLQESREDDDANEEQEGEEEKEKEKEEEN